MPVERIDDDLRVERRGQGHAVDLDPRVRDPHVVVGREELLPIGTVRGRAGRQDTVDHVQRRFRNVARVIGVGGRRFTCWHLARFGEVLKTSVRTDDPGVDFGGGACCLLGTPFEDAEHVLRALREDRELR
jgi:hypothetical protein